MTAIVGGGIGGLAAALELWKKKEPFCLFEASGRLGGMMQTKRVGPFLFEEGPRTFPLDRCPLLLQMIKELGLEGDLAISSLQGRYIYTEGKLYPLKKAASLLWKELLQEPFRPRISEEVTVDVWARRRFGPLTADLLFDPLVTGIFGASSKETSMAAAFPTLFAKRSALFSLLFVKKSPLFTLRGGMGQIGEKMLSLLHAHVRLNEEVIAIEGGNVITAQGTFPFEKIIVATPPAIAGKILKFPALHRVESQEISLVHLGYNTPPRLPPGFGYLVPSKEGEKVLGALFGPVITVLLKEGGKEEALSALERHLGIWQKPDMVEMSWGKIPKYPLYHREKMAEIQTEMEAKWPNVFLAGNYLTGPSVEMTIESALKASGCIRSERDWFTRF